MEDSLAGSRSKRQKTDKHGRFAALTKLKELKGSKHKYEVTKEAPVYEEVDEVAYSKLVQERQEDDWIVDDGTGYVEDGREIFDDDLEERSSEIPKNSKPNARKDSFKPPTSKKAESSSNSRKDIKSMFMAQPKKRRVEQEIKLDDDELLGDIMKDIHNSSFAAPSPKPTLLRKKSPAAPLHTPLRSAVNPFASKLLPSKQVVQKRDNWGWQIDNDLRYGVRNTKQTIPPVEEMPDDPEFEENCLKEMEMDQRSKVKVIFLSERGKPATDSHGFMENKRRESGTQKEETESKTRTVRFSSESSKPGTISREIEENKRQVGPQEKVAKRQSVNVVFHDEVLAEQKAEARNCAAVKGHLDNLTSQESYVPKEDMLVKRGCEKMHDELEIDESSQFTREDEAEVEKAEKNRLIVPDQVESVKDWWDVSVAANAESPSVNVSIDTSSLPLTTNAKGEQVFQFFWLDAYEDYFKHPGTVYIFGKVWIEKAKTHVSCCVVVKNITRRILILPREKRKNTDEPVSMKDVYKEFDSIADKFKIGEYKSKVVQKSYAFEKYNVPSDNQYLEVHYSTSYPALPSDLEGSTFSLIFGTRTSSLEILLLDRKFHGPSWIEIQSPQLSNPPVSWCKIEVLVNSMQNIQVVFNTKTPPPPLVVMAMTLQTVINNATNKSEIVAASCLIHDNFHVDKPAPSPPFKSHFCALTKPNKNCIFPIDFKEKLRRYDHTKVEISGNERALLAFLLNKIHRIDPDMIVGHDIVGFDLEILLDRLGEHKIAQWSRLGRLKRSEMPKHVSSQKKGSQQDKGITCGRLVCDVMLSAKELIRSPSYDLNELVSQVLSTTRHQIPVEVIPKMFSSSEEILRLVDSNMLDATYVLRLMCELNILPLALQITKIAGNIMSRTLLGGRSERNEYLLLHAFHEKNFVVPDKFRGKAKVDSEEEPAGKRGRRKPAYTGGLVLEPKKGLYDKYILLMDFNSLYPSIIQEFNICFTTMPRMAPSKEGDEETPLEVPEPGLAPGILPTEIRKLVESRRHVKKLMSAPHLSADLKLQYDIRQKALKLTANSMYGCLGFSNSRFYAKHLAALVTSKGREILLHTRDTVQRMGLEVIYGDTDSIMVNTNSTQFDEVMKLGSKIKSEINKLYKLLEIDIDGVFKSILLLKKKQYAALAVTKLPNGQMSTTKEVKGLEIVRRDWSKLAKKAGEFVIGEILSEKTREDVVQSIHDYLTDVGNKVRAFQFPLSEYLITKQLTKNADEYADKKSLPHVQVALRMNTKGGKKLRQGDAVPYLICQDGSNLPATQRAYHPEEFKHSETLKIDTQYYLSQQLLPVISRLCDPIEGTDIPTLAEFLGLDPASYKQHVRHRDADEDLLLGADTMMNDEKRYEQCDPLRLRCTLCLTEVSVRTTLVDEDSHPDYSLAECSRCLQDLAVNIPAFCGQLHESIRSYQRKYYQSWMTCEDLSCAYRTRKVSLQVTQAGLTCPACQKANLRREYTDDMLYLQLSFFQNILDLSKVTVEIKRKDVHEYSLPRNMVANVSMYRKLKEVVDNALKVDMYGIINLADLFESLYRAPTRTQ